MIKDSMIHRHYIRILILSAFLLPTQQAAAEILGDDRPEQTSHTEVDEWLDAAGELNRPTMTDPAGSHGSYGIDVGAGYGRLSVNENNPVISEEMGGNPDSDQNSAIDVPRVWVSKGTMLPVDFTVTGGMTRDRSFSSIGGIAQVTVFESRLLPAVSLRAYAGRMFGRAHTNLSSRGGEAIVSMGFLRYFQGYLASALTKHTAAVEIAPESTVAILLKESDSDHIYRREWQKWTHTAGLKITVIPGRLSVTGETFRFQGHSDAFTLRMTTYL